MVSITTLCLLTILGAGPLVPPDSLVAPMRADTLTETELGIFPPPGVLLPVSYRIAWGDGTTLDWTKPLRSRVDTYRYHQYRRLGRFGIQVRARDSLGRISEWSKPLFVTVTDPPLKWAFPTFDPIYASPTLDHDGNIYVGDEEGWFYSIDPQGQLRWSFETGGSIVASAAIARNPALSARKGCNPLSWFAPRPTGTSDLVYVPALDSHLYCFDTEGELQWKLLLGDEFYTAPAIGSDGTIYVGSDTGALLAVTPDGKLRWSFETGAEIASSPSIGHDGLIYITSDSVYCLDSRRRLRWAFGAGEEDPYFSFFAPAVPDAAGTVYAPNTDGFLYAIGPDGRLRWRAPVPEEDEIHPEVIIGPADTLYLGTDSDYLCRKPPRGTIVHIYETEDIIVAPPALAANGTLYFLPDDGYFYALSSRGRLLWRYEIAADDKDLYFASAPVIAPDGTVYVGSWDGGLFAFKGDAPPADTPWPQYRHDAQHTGRLTR